MALDNSDIPERNKTVMGNHRARLDQRQTQTEGKGRAAAHTDLGPGSQVLAQPRAAPGEGDSLVPLSTSPAERIRRGVLRLALQPLPSPLLTSEPVLGDSLWWFSPQICDIHWSLFPQTRSLWRHSFSSVAVSQSLLMTTLLEFPGHGSRIISIDKS